MDIHKPVCDVRVSTSFIFILSMVAIFQHAWDVFYYQATFLQGCLCLASHLLLIWTWLSCQLRGTGFARPKPRPTNTHFLPTSSLSCSTVGGTSCLLLVSWHPYRPIMSRVVPPNQVPLRPHYSHFYLLHTAAVHHLMMLDPATAGARRAGSCSLSGCTSNQAPLRLLKLNSITLKCYVSILFCQVRIFTLAYFLVPSLCRFPLEYMLSHTTTSSASVSSPQ